MPELPALITERLAAAMASSRGRSALKVIHDGPLRQTVIALAGGQKLEEHNTPPAATLQVLHGRVRMTSAIAALAIDAHDPRRVADFWAAALGWEILEVDDYGVSIGPQDGSSPGIDVLVVPEAKTLKNRLHLDLRADGSTQADEVERLLALGATRADVGQGPDVSWVVLADPEGNEFCVLARSVQDLGERA